MTINRVLLVLLAVLLLPGLAMAQTTTRATLNVNKTFVDGNTASVTVHLDCNTGLPLEQSQSISNSGGVAFIVESFDDGEMDCEVTEGTYAGYTAEYGCDGSSSDCGSDESGCSFSSISDGDENYCSIDNYPDAQEVTVWKDWIIDGDGGDLLDTNYKIKLTCDNEILGGDPCRKGDTQTVGDDYGYCQGGTWSWTFWNDSGSNDASYTADVIPDWDGGTNCWVDEKIYDSSVESSGDCSFNVDIAETGEGCTITNTVFYEGIPTLSQYGLAILALLMLGVGFVGFRRFV